MPATVPACCGSKCRSRLIFGKARDVFGRSIKAIVYMMRATGMMRIQRCEIRDAAISVRESGFCAVFIMIKNSPLLFRRSTAASGRQRRRQPAFGCCLWLYLIHPHFGIFILVMRDCEIVAVQFWNQDARLGAKAAGNSRQQHIMVGILLIEDIE